jgi:Zn-dependent peptidase ImmA (M78 family)
MDEKEFNQDEINRLINSAWDGKTGNEILSLREKFEKRLLDLGITFNQAEQNLQIAYRTLNGILDGDLQRFDLLSLLKVGHFLEIPEHEIVEMYTKFVAEKHREDLEQAKKRTFILNNFDLPVLKNIGVINSIRDFEHVEQQINLIFGLQSIMDYDTEDTGAALSSTKIKPKNDKSRKYFKSKSKLIFRLINNPHRYEKQALIDYFPKIRWHSTEVENGMLNVLKSLFELGLTVIFQPSMPSLQMRGATFEVNGKPCIALTDYRKSYPTLWFALLHELFHVLFDWDEILLKRYHLSDEETDLFVVRQREEEANDFAREYLFPTAKLELISSRIKQPVIVKEFALDNHVHPSILYANYAFKNSTEENNLWQQLDKSIRPPMESLIKKLGNGLSHKSPAIEFATYYKKYIFNTE